MSNASHRKDRLYITDEMRQIQITPTSEYSTNATSILITRIAVDLNKYSTPYRHYSIESLDIAASRITTLHISCNFTASLITVSRMLMWRSHTHDSSFHIPPSHALQSTHAHIHCTHEPTKILAHTHPTRTLTGLPPPPGQYPA
jgi:hypothetical protein